jgi:hypothetical protein
MTLPAIDLSFDSFWAVYPRKQDKKGAEKAFDKLKDVDKYNCIHGAAYQAKNHAQWNDPSLIPLPTTFINGARWQDEINNPTTVAERVIESPKESNADVVWSAMYQMYGDLWISKFGEKPLEIWRKMLAPLTVERIKRGLRRTVEAKKEFPPSLPLFMEYCTKSFEEHYPSLPRPRGNRDVALDAFRQMKDLLGVNNEAK